MHGTFPILLFKQRNSYIARPLLFSEPSVFCSKRVEAISELEIKMGFYLNILIAQGNTHEVARRLRNPNYTLFFREIDLDQSNLFLHMPLLFIRWKEGETEFLNAPFLEDFFFTVPQNENAETYTQEALKIWIQRQKENYDITTIAETLNKQDKQIHVETVTGNLVLFDGLVPSGSDSMSDPYRVLLSKGRKELRTIGRDHRFFPDDTQEPIQLEKIVRLEERLHAVLTAPERKSVILLGGLHSGRSRLANRVLRRIDRGRNYHEVAGELIANKNVVFVPGWTLTPGKMIAGMSLSGQWESRCRAIFEFASYSDLILRFEPFLGFLETGKSGQGKMSISDVIRSELTRERFRALIELTPEELRLLRERDRLLARRFEIIEMPNLTRQEEYEIAIQSWQAEEIQRHRFIPPLFLPTLFQMTDYFEQEKAAPGRIGRWISTMHECLDSVGAADYNTDILSKKVQTYYAEKTGHNVSFFQPPEIVLAEAPTKKKKQTHRERIKEELAMGLVGQSEALERLADTVLKIRTHLNDLSQTAGAFLFVGPTGVGKTEAAKQLARVLFGSEENGLIRFDANELTTSQSVAALLGGRNREGSLVSAVRMRPNCVLLFDEIEKAHPDLADLLLQVLGEGRLTDGFGRVVSFTQCVIIFTSNLGARDAERFTGFDTADRKTIASYDRAVRDFFRPEWLNRLDAIVPFERLSQAELVTISKRMIESIKSREGFHKRNVFLNITPNAVAFLTKRVGDVRWGARGVIRLLEKELVTPAAAFLAETKPEKVSALEADIRDEKLFFYPCVFDAPPVSPLLTQEFTPELKNELAEATTHFLHQNKNRYFDLFPITGRKATQEEIGRRHLYLSEYDRLIQETYAEDKKQRQTQVLHNTRKAKMMDRGESVRKMRDESASCYKRANLFSTEWDDFLSATYQKTSDEIAAGAKEADRTVAENFSLTNYYVNFAAFGPHEKKREGAIRIEKVLGRVESEEIFYDCDALAPYLLRSQSSIANRVLYEENDEWRYDYHNTEPLRFPFFPDWFPSPELKRGTTPSGLTWSSAVLDDAVFWMTSFCESQLYNGSLFLVKILRFDPETESPEEVIARWEQDPNRTWGPMSDFSFPESWLPESIREILQRHLDASKSQGKNRGKEERP